MKRDGRHAHAVAAVVVAVVAGAGLAYVLVEAMRHGLCGIGS